MTSCLDLIPWETKPKENEQQIFTVDWNDGSFQIPRYGYLEVDELNKIRQVDPTNELYRLTSKTAVELNKELQSLADSDMDFPLPVLQARQCFALLSSLLARHMGAASSLNEAEEAIQISFSHIISPYLDQGRAISERVPIRSATIILQRIRPGWTDEETKKLPPDLFNTIYNFYQEEEAAGQPPTNPDEQLKELEEQLGKLRADMKSIAIGQTGPKSSGNAEDFGQVPKNSTGKITGDSQDILSSQPSKRVTRRKGKLSIDKS